MAASTSERRAGLLRAGRALALAAALGLPLAVPSVAQQRAPASQSRPAPQQPAPPPPQPEPPPAPYEPDLLQLSEVLGSLAFLRTLCIGSEEPVWREKMAGLIESEGRTEARRARLAGAYNRGFRAYALTYRACTASAEEASLRLAREGDALARRLAGRFGG